MKKQLLILPSILFLLILSIFFYLLIIDRNPSELPSTLLDKNVPKFETESLLKNEKFVSSKEFGNEIILVNFFKLVLIEIIPPRKIVRAPIHIHITRGL